MKYNILGNTGLQVSSLCLGTMNYGGKGFFGYMGNLDQTAVDEQIKKAPFFSEKCFEFVCARLDSNQHT